MSRKYAQISKEDLNEKLSKLSEEDGSLQYAIREKFDSDLKVHFDTENFEDSECEYCPMNGYQVLDGFPFWGFTAGGDWEHPIYFIVYWDGKKLRAYIPTEGNPFNTSTRWAYGNDGENEGGVSDADNGKFRGYEVDSHGEVHPEFDWEKIKADIKTRILPAETKKPCNEDDLQDAHATIYNEYQRYLNQKITFKQYVKITNPILRKAAQLASKLYS